jgi:hypothetical protein
MSRRRPCIAALALLVLAGAPSPARADVFGPIGLASESAVPGSDENQQADYAHDPAISGNGRYVAFDGSYAGLTGVWRRDLQTGVVEPVATENPLDPAISAPDADLPSISAEGRYVSFTTTAALDPVDDTNPGPDVYVRDMDIPVSAPCEPGPSSPHPCAYVLASAVNGSNTGLTYEPTGRLTPEFEEEHYGSLAAGRTALSENGEKVAFVTTAVSNLAGLGTPAMQVAVRDLRTDTTELVSVADEPATGAPIPGRPVSGREGANTYGAVFSSSGGQPPIFADPEPYEPPAPVGASISGDGTTVAWLGVDVGQQARTLSDETLLDSYTEPLWRRIADGPGAPVRRVTGGSDPSNPACIASGETVLPSNPSTGDPCQGPFAASQQGRVTGTWSGGAGDPIPRLSENGEKVALLSDAPLVALGQGFASSEVKSDAYVVNMNEGLSRMQALQPLTELAGGNQQSIAEDGPIEDIGIAPDGEQVAFTTKRTQFPLGSPAYVSAPAAVPGMLELFDADLADDTLTRVTHGFEGGPSEHPHSPVASGEDPYVRPDDGALSPSYSSDGGTLAFSSTASNLVFGDGNTPPLGDEKFDGSDAFTVSRVVFTPEPTPESIAPTPPPPAIAPAWRLGVTASARADGTVLLYATVPGSGTLRAVAKSALRVRVRRHGRFSTALASASVATAQKAVRAPSWSLATLALTIAPRYSSLAEKRPGLSSAIAVTFAAPGHPTLRQTVDVSFSKAVVSRAARSAKHRRSAPAKEAGHGRRAKSARTYLVVAPLGVTAP